MRRSLAFLGFSLLSAALFWHCSGSTTGGSVEGGDLSQTDRDGGTTPVDLAGLGGPGTVVVVNQCSQPIWVAALNNGSSTFIPDGGGWKQEPGEARVVTLPNTWGGRFWGRTGCTFDGSGRGSCETGDCGGRLQCNGLSGKTPASLVEFQFAGFGKKDFYDVSLVDGYNLPIAVAAQAGTYTRSNPNSKYDCGAPTCRSDLNQSCPQALQQIVAGRVVGCRSAHAACGANRNDPALACAANDDLYACAAGGPNSVMGSCYSPGATTQCCGCPGWSDTGTCRATNPKWALPSLPETFAKPFKTACPDAYSFPYDDPTSTYTCAASAAAGVGYIVTFCP